MQQFDAFFSPVTHMLLAVPMTLFGTEREGLWAGAVLWCALSCAIPLFAWRFTRLVLTPAAALTALFCALWPLYVTYGGFFTSETPSRVSNLAYSLALPLVVIYSLSIVWRRRASGLPSGAAVLLLQLACALVVAIIFFGDPRLRSTYDVFGLGLLAACIVDLLGLEGPKGKRAE